MNRLFVLSIVLLGLGACGGGGSDGNGGDDAPPPVSTVDFNQFALEEFDLTDVNDEPAEINDITFRFDDDDSAFDSVL